MAPQTPEILELIYATKSLAQAVEGVSTDLERLSVDQERQAGEIRALKDLVGETTKMLEVQEEIIRFLPLQLMERVQQAQDKSTEHISKLLGVAERDRDQALEEVRKSLSEIKEKIASVKTHLMVNKAGSLPSKEEEELGRIELKNDGKLKVMFGVKAETIALAGKWLWRTLLFLGAGGGATAGLKALNEWLQR